MHCATCNSETELELCDSANIDICPDGHGLWIEPVELLEIIRTDPNAESHVGAQGDEGAGDPCIECGRTTVPFRYNFSSGTVGYTCPEHGMWLESADLIRLREWAATTFKPGSPDTEVYLARAELHETGDSDVHTTFVQINIVEDFFQKLIDRLKFYQES